MELGATVCTARAPRCDACPVAAWCASAGRRPCRAARARRGAAERFEDSNRWVRGRVVAALAAGEGLPGGHRRRSASSARSRGWSATASCAAVDGGFSLG